GGRARAPTRRAFGSAMPRRTPAAGSHYALRRATSWLFSGGAARAAYLGGARRLVFRGGMPREQEATPSSRARHRLEAGFSNSQGQGPKILTSHKLARPVHPLEKLLEERIAIIDGAMGTTIRSYEMKEADIRGHRFANAK